MNEHEPSKAAPAEAIFDWADERAAILLPAACNARTIIEAESIIADGLRSACEDWRQRALTAEAEVARLVKIVKPLTRNLGMLEGVVSSLARVDRAWDRTSREYAETNLIAPVRALAAEVGGEEEKGE